MNTQVNYRFILQAEEHAFHNMGIK
jgi:hypothetical protein